MRDLPRFAATLTLVTVIAACSLAWINQITRPRISAQQEAELNNALEVVLPGSGDGVIVPVEENRRVVYYKGYSQPDTSGLIGYAFLAPAQGYSSTIRTLAGMDTSGALLAIRVLSQQETPGLGTRIQETASGESEPWWQTQFQGKPVFDLAVDKDGGSIESITGATITSRAVTDAVADSARSLYSRVHSGSGF